MQVTVANDVDVVKCDIAGVGWATSTSWTGHSQESNLYHITIVRCCAKSYTIAGHIVVNVGRLCDTVYGYQYSVG